LRKAAGLPTKVLLGFLSHFTALAFQASHSFLSPFSTHFDRCGCLLLFVFFCHLCGLMFVCWVDFFLLVVCEAVCIFCDSNVDVLVVMRQKS